MATLSVADARKHLSDVITRSKSGAVFIERRGQRAAVVVSLEQCVRQRSAR
ncbi:MAG TPA: type II toxin-antitoxin system prevent-host-death family antitoxin [Terrimesophilobacter sp.]|nr:type II toxin-antitoxin system prevent-host-death family antitoxin [Terrimesophilobacter sp.]